MIIFFLTYRVVQFVTLKIVGESGSLQFVTLTQLYRRKEKLTLVAVWPLPLPGPTSLFAADLHHNQDPVQRWRNRRFLFPVETKGSPNHTLVGAAPEAGEAC